VAAAIEGPETAAIRFAGGQALDSDERFGYESALIQRLLTMLKIAAFLRMSMLILMALPSPPLRHLDRMILTQKKATLVMISTTLPWIS
jgi:hypothetical protein